MKRGYWTIEKEEAGYVVRYRDNLVSIKPDMAGAIASLENARDLLRRGLLEL